MKIIDHVTTLLQRAGFDGGDQAHYPPDLDLEPIHRDIDLAIDIPAETAAGRVTTTVVARRPGARSIELHAEDMEIADITDPDGNELQYNYDGTHIAISWALPFERGQERRFAIDYRVAKPRSGLFFSSPSEAYPEAATYAATDHETERARHWLPCVDLPSVRTSLELHLRAQADLEILANGHLVSTETHEDGTRTAHWRLEQRCPSYLTCFAIGDFTRADDGEVDGVPLAYFSSTEHSAEDLLRTFGRTGQMLRWMIDKLDAPFPYPKYYQFALPGFGGAMENISLVSWNDLFVLDEALASEWAWLIDQINVHEMAHSYFGDLIVCRDFAHAWLKESWATYFEQVWLEDVKGAHEADYDYYRNAHAYFDEADGAYKRPIVTRVFRSSWQMYDRHLYPGGACRLHTLRAELGTDVFWEAVRDYVKRYAHKVVETDDFRRVLEERSGRSLGRFFDQWLHTAAYPDIKVTFSYDEEKKQGRFEIEQKQVDEKEGVPPFLLHTDVGWHTGGTLHTKAITLEGQREVVLVPMDTAPDHVRFDPGVKVLHKLELEPGDEMLRHQIRQAEDVIGRILAARALAKSGKNANIDAIVDAHDHEPFWGVREQMGKALAEAHTDHAVGALALLIEREPDPTVVGTIIGAAKVYRDERITEATLARLERGLGPLASAAAFETLGHQRANAPMEVLEAGAAQPSVGGIAQSGAFRGLAASRTEQALELLLGAVAYGATSNRSRPAAIGALAALAAFQDKPQKERAIEVLVDLLRDPFAPARRAAALEGYRATVSVQEKVQIDKVLARLRAPDDPKVASLTKELEKMREIVRKLDARVQDVESRLQPVK